MLLAACGSSSGDTTTSSQSSGGSTGTTAQDGPGGPFSGFTLDEPLVLGQLWEVQGESPAAINDFEYGAKLAIEEINAAGGVGGHPIKTVREPYSPSDAQAARSAFLKVTEKQPAVLLGAIGSTLEGLTRDVDAAGIPLLGNLSDNKVLLGAPSGSEWIFSVPSSYLDLADAAAQFTADEFDPTEVGLFNTSDPSNTSAIDATKAALDELGIAIGVSETVGPTATDVTSSVLALADEEAVLAAAYPQPLALALKSRAQNNLTMPVVSVGVSGPIIVNSEAVTPAQTQGFYTAIQCNPASKNTPAIQKFTDAYEGKFGAAPTTQAAVQYDSVYLAVTAVAMAGSTDPGAIRQALTELRYEGGVCTDDYHADAAQLMSHNATIVSWADADQTVIKTYTFPDRAKQS